MDCNALGCEQVWISHPMLPAPRGPAMGVLPMGASGHALLAPPARASSPLGPPQHASLVCANCTGKKDCQNGMGNDQAGCGEAMKKEEGPPQTVFIFLSVPRNVVVAFQYTVSTWLAQPWDR